MRSRSFGAEVAASITRLISANYRWKVRFLQAVVLLATGLTGPAIASAASAARGAGTATASRANFARAGASCSVSLADTPGYFEAPPPPGKYMVDLMRGLATHNTYFGDTAHVTFGNCHPKRVLFIGDSIAFTLAFGMLSSEQRYGLEIGGDPREACSFNTAGLLLVNGGYHSEPTYCPTEIEHWVADEASFHPDAVVVEFGWRDEFAWLINGRHVALGDPGFDTLVKNGIERLIEKLGQGHIPILFLTVPWAAPAFEPNGSPAPQGSPQRHQFISDLLRQAAVRHASEVSVFDIDPIVSPGNHYDQYVDGHRCRVDGLHFAQFCAQLVEPYVLNEVNQMISSEPPPYSIVAIAANPHVSGYWLVDERGNFYGHGDAHTYANSAPAQPAGRVVGIAPTPDGRGYWLVTSAGSVYPFGDAANFGSMAGRALAAPVVGLAPTKDGRGYWLVASDGGVFSFGDAKYHGSMGGRHLNAPIVSIAADDAAGGYWMVAADGGVFSFGATFLGSAGGVRLAKPIVGMEALPASNGYRLVASDGGVFSFGAAPFAGSLGGRPVTSPVVGIAPQTDKTGYWLAQADGQVTGFGGAHTH